MRSNPCSRQKSAIAWLQLHIGLMSTDVWAFLSFYNMNLLNEHIMANTPSLSIRCIDKMCKSPPPLIFKKQPGCQMELQKGLDGFWLSGTSPPPLHPAAAPTFIAFVSVFFPLLRHILSHEYPDGSSIIISPSLYRRLCVCLSACTGTCVTKMIIYALWWRSVTFLHCGWNAETHHRGVSSLSL